MSVKFQKDTISQTAGVAGTQGIGTIGGDRHPLATEIGTALTGGKGNVGQPGYLAFYLKQLQSNPLRTKMLTSGTLSGLQELLASWIAKDRNKNGHYFTARIPKMAAYGAFVSAPLGHVLISILQKLFAGRTSLKAKILQILVSNLVIAPIQNSVYLVSMALIAGAKTFHQVHATWSAGFMRVMKVSWITSPLALAFAQQFLPEHTWVPFFNLIGFIIGTYVNTVQKKLRIKALEREYQDEQRRRNRPGEPKRDY